MRLTGMAISMALTLALIGAGESRAVDGVLEINQACAVNTGCFSGDTAGFPVTISASSSYVLTSELTVPNQNTTAIDLNANEVSIDLNGFAITGDGTTGSGLGIDGQGQGRIWVGNGVIRGTGSNGIRVGGGSTVESVRVSVSASNGVVLGDNCRIVNSTAHGNTGSGFIMISGDRSSVVNSHSFANGGKGIECTPGCSIRGNTVAENTGIGIDADGTISSNSVNNNGSHGIVANSGSVVLGNHVRANGGDGLLMSADSGYGQNVISNSGGLDIPASGVSINTSNVCGGVAC